MTNATPLFSGTFRRKISIASNPPAEAPIPTIGTSASFAGASALALVGSGARVAGAVDEFLNVLAFDLSAGFAGAEGADLSFAAAADFALEAPAGFEREAAADFAFAGGACLDFGEGRGRASGARRGALAFLDVSPSRFGVEDCRDFFLPMIAWKPTRFVHERDAGRFRHVVRCALRAV